MRRRDLFNKLAAITAAVALAPAVEAEAAPSEVMPTLPEGEVWVLSSEVAQARAEGYTRGYDVASAAAESKALQNNLQLADFHRAWAMLKETG
jgi:hypothetical protein